MEDDNEVRERTLAIEELIEQMQNDDLQDRLEHEQSVASPIDYAKSRRIKPQKVYAAMRDPKNPLPSYRCACSRLVIDIKQADDYFAERAKKSDKRRPENA